MASRFSSRLKLSFYQKLSAITFNSVIDIPLVNASQRVSSGNLLPSSSTLGCAWWLSSTSHFSAYSTAAQSVKEEVGGQGDDSLIITLKKLRDSLDLGIAPERGLVPQLLQKSHTSEHVDLAFKALSDLRTENAVRRKEFANFSSEVALALVRACIRAGDGIKGLRALRKQNSYGLSPSLATANAILEFGSETGNLNLVMRAFREAVDSGLKPSTRMAETVLRACEKNGDAKRFIRMGKEFGSNNVTISPETHDKLLEAAATLGRSKTGLLQAGWRSQQGYPSTIVSAISTAKLHLLEGEIDAAFNDITSISKEDEQKNEWSEALTAMVCEWPQKLPKRSTGECIAISMDVLKERMLKLEELLQSQSIKFPVQVESGFSSPLSAEE